MITIRTWTLSGSGAGCYYAYDHAVALYSKTYRSVVPIHIRYYQDSFISADELTLGCSYSSPDSSSCFGMSRKEQNLTGSILFLIGGILTLIEIFAVVAMCMCCRDRLKKKPTKEKDETYASLVPPAQPVPSAQPVPPTQPGYVPQPSYAPQPSYVPQPGYAQPSYVPQPGYAQPSYVPQPGYAQPQPQPSYYPQ